MSEEARDERSAHHAQISGWRDSNHRVYRTLLFFPAFGHKFRTLCHQAMKSPRITRSRVPKCHVHVLLDMDGKVVADQQRPVGEMKSEVGDEKETLTNTSTSEVSQTEDPDKTIVAEEPETPVVQTVKRKRGRPRKHPVSEVTAKKLKFELKSGTPTSAGSSPTDSMSGINVVFPVTPYPGKTGTMCRVPRPPNAFMIFGKENRKRLSLANPGSTNKDVSRLLGEQWQSMDESEKEPYRESARQALTDHKNKYPNYQYIPTEARMRKKFKAAAKAAADQLRNSDVGPTFCEKVTASPLTDPSVANKENIPPADPTAQNSDADPQRVITELFVAPPGYEDVEIVGLDKFVLWENKLIPYREWLGAEGDVKRLSGTYTQVPDQLLQPITNCVIAGTNLDSPAVAEQSRPGPKGLRDSGQVVNTMAWRQSDENMTLNECNAAASSEADKCVPEAEKSGSEMDAQRLLQDLMSDGRTGGGEATVVLMNEPQTSASASRRLFWNESCVTSDDDD